MEGFDKVKVYLERRPCVIDNRVFWLHYRLTVVMLFAAQILVIAKKNFGEPIACMANAHIPEKHLNFYCWTHTTFSVVSAWEKRVGEEVVYPGVEQHTTNEKRVYHSYYQWVPIVLFIQAVLFYAPRYMWKCVEDKRVEKLVKKLDVPLVEEEVKNTNRALLVEYLYKNLGNHNFFFWSFVFFEVLNFLNVILQMYLMDLFFGGQFTQYGFEVMRFSEWAPTERYDPMIKVFPRLTKCTYRQTGSSGDVQKHDALCLLPLNIVNEKIFIILWFWFYLLAIVSLVCLFYRLATILIPRVRYFSIANRCLFNKEGLLWLCDRRPVSDWFVLNLISKNVDRNHFGDVVHDLILRLEGKI